MLASDRAATNMTAAPVYDGPGPECPSCCQTMAPGAKICIGCGIYLKSGRPLFTASGFDEDDLHTKAENSIRVISWLVPFGLYPVASEAYGTQKPYAIWTIFCGTLLASALFFVAALSSSNQLPAGSNFMLWAGDHDQAAQQLVRGNELMEQFERHMAKARAAIQKADAEGLRHDYSEYEASFEFDENLSESDLEALEYARAVAGGQPVHGFKWYQLLTHALLHGGLMHIAGNMLFLLVFGTRVNALIGNLQTAIVYPILAILAGWAHMLSESDQQPVPMLGASGAIMGLAGMYFVLFPVHKVYMTIWLRLGIFTGFKLLWKMWALRGFWVVLFYIAFDVLATVLGSKDDVAHWAHLGGFLFGMAIGLILLLSRLVNARGGDILSVMLGKHAWPLIGKPSQWKDDLPASVLAQRAVSMNYQ